jgi:hypothetical protein
MDLVASVEATYSSIRLDKSVIIMAMATRLVAQGRVARGRKNGPAPQSNCPFFL